MLFAIYHVVTHFGVTVVRLQPLKVKGVKGLALKVKGILVLVVSSSLLPLITISFLKVTVVDCIIFRE